MCTSTTDCTFRFLDNILPCTSETAGKHIDYAGPNERHLNALDYAVREAGDGDFMELEGGKMHIMAHIQYI